MSEKQKGTIKKRGRKPKNQKKEVSLNQEQTKFFIDQSNDIEFLDLIFSLLRKSIRSFLFNEHGKAIGFLN